MADATNASDKHAPKGRRFWFVAALLLTAHLSLVNHFVPIAEVFSPRVLRGDDFDLHIGQIVRVVEGLEGWGQSWVYDVKLLAGQPEGAICDSGSKGWELWTYVGHNLGLSMSVAINSFVFFVSVACPLVVFAAAWLFGLGAWTSLLAATMASSLWFFDSFAHWLWWVGMISYAGAAYLALLVLALFFRYLERPRTSTAIVCGLLLAIVLLIHPYSFFVLAPPMAALYLRAFADLPRSTHLTVVALGIAALGANAYWLRAALLHWHYILNSAFYGQAGASYAVADFFQVLLTPADTGAIGTRTGFRFLYFALCAAGLWGWRRNHDRRVLPFSTALITLLLLAYFGGYIPGASQVQPYRHILPASFLATLPAAAFLQMLWRARAAVLSERTLRASTLVVLLVCMQHLGTQALYFLPGLVPEAADLLDGSPSPLSKYGYLRPVTKQSHVDYVLPHAAWLELGANEVAAWVKANVPAGQRVLIDSGLLGERVAWRTDVEVMGGFLERNIDHAYANFFRRFPERQATEAEVAEYLRTFAISYVITQKTRPEFEQAPRLLEKLPDVAGRSAYRTRLPVSMFLEGKGVVRARTNRIEVHGSDPHAPLVLSYHFHEALRCEPNCRVVRANVRMDTVGLIRIPAPHPADLAVVNSYQF